MLKLNLNICTHTRARARNCIQQNETLIVNDYNKIMTNNLH